MRILLYNDNKQKVGGAEIYMYGLAELLREAGHTVRIFAMHDAPIGLDKQSRWQFYRHAYFFSTRIYKAMRAEIEAFAPDIIHIQNNYYFTWSVLRAVAESKIPVVQTLHDLYNFSTAPLTVATDSLPKRIFKQLAFLSKKPRYRYVARVVQQFITTNQKFTTQLEQAGYDPILCFSFIQAKHWPLLLTRDYTRPRLLYVGRIEDYKGIPTLLEASLRLRKQFPDLQVRLVGQGNYSTQVKAFIQKHSAESWLHLEGPYSLHELANIQHWASTAVVPSSWDEPFGLTGIEAQASGTPVVATRVGGIPTWCKHEKTGLLIPPNDVEAFAAAVQRLWEHPTFAKTLAQTASEAVHTQFSEDAHLKKLLNIYAQVLARN